jgi:hypothetical protein
MKPERTSLAGTARHWNGVRAKRKHLPRSTDTLLKKRQAPARMAKLADARDLKSRVRNRT